MKRTAVINVVGLTGSLIGEHTPRIREFSTRGAKASIAPFTVSKITIRQPLTKS